MQAILSHVLGPHNEVPTSFVVTKRHCVIALALSVGTVLALLYKIHGVPILDDVVQHQMWAKDCVEGIRCHFSGNDFDSLSISGGLRRRWLMGALPIHIFASLQWLGVSIRQMHLMMVGFLGIQTGLVYLFTIRMIGRRFALATALFSLYLVLGWSLFPNLYNDSLNSFFILAFMASLSLYVHRKSARYRWLALLALFLAGEGHILNYFLVVIYATYVAVYARRPFRAIFVPLCVLALLVSVYSHEGYYINVMNLVYLEAAFPTLLGLSLFGIIIWVPFAAGLRRFYHTRRDRWVIQSAFLSSGLFLFLVIWIASAVKIGDVWHFLQGFGMRGAVYWWNHYFQIVFPFAAMLLPVLVVRLLEKLSEWIGASQTKPILRFLVFLNILLWTYSYLQRLGSNDVYGSDTTEACWTMTDVETVTKELTARGYSYPDIRFRVQTHDLTEFMQTVPVFLSFSELTDERALDPKKKTLLIVKILREDLPKKKLSSAYRILDLEGEYVAVLRSIDSWIDRSRIEYTVQADMNDTTCNAWRTNRFVAHPYEDWNKKPTSYVRPIDHSILHLSGQLYEKMKNDCRNRHVALFLKTPVQSLRRMFVAIDHEKYWRLVTDLEGASNLGSLPASVLYVKTTTDRTGRMVIGQAKGRKHREISDYRYPSILELHADERWLFKALTHMHPELDTTLLARTR